MPGLDLGWQGHYSHFQLCAFWASLLLPSHFQQNWLLYYQESECMIVSCASFFSFKCSYTRITNKAKVCEQISLFDLKLYKNSLHKLRAIYHHHHSKNNHSCEKKLCKKSNLQLCWVHLVDPLEGYHLHQS